VVVIGQELARGSPRPSSGLACATAGLGDGPPSDRICRWRGTAVSRDSGGADSSWVTELGWAFQLSLILNLSVVCVLFAYNGPLNHGFLSA